MQKVVSLKTAKLLVEKGIVLKTKERCIKWSIEDVMLGRKNKLNIPRPDIPELLAELPDWNENEMWLIFRDCDSWFVQCRSSEDVIDGVRKLNKEFQRDELVEALAQALIWVKERGGK